MRQYWVVWDGECGMCSASAAWVRRKDRSRIFQIVSFQNCPNPPLTPEILADCPRALYVLGPEGKYWRGADGFLIIMSLVGWGAFARLLMLPPFIWPIRLGYSLVARNRSWISKTFYGGRSCGLDNRYPEIDELPAT